MKIHRFRPVLSGLVLLVALSATLPITVGYTAESTPRLHQDIPVGFTDDGHPYIGNSDAAVTLEEWSDYLCPYCARHYRQTYPQLLEQYIKSGQLKLVFRDLPLDGLHPTAALGHVAAHCVGEQGAAAYWAMHDSLFTRQAEWNRLPDPGEFLADLASERGANMDAYTECVSNGEVAARVAASVVEGRGLGYNGTPGFRFNAEGKENWYVLSGAHPLARFASIADPLIAGEEPPEDPKPEPPEMPLWAKPEGLKPDPARPGFNTAGDAYKGNPDAPLAVVEFNDFQCPACQTHALETQPAIDRQLIDTGKILWVDKHLPLKMHPYAPVAAVAAECAGDQQRYWQMHASLHKNSERWANEKADSALVNLARELDFDIPAFRSCLDSRRGLERVLADIYDAQGTDWALQPNVILITLIFGTM